MIDEDILINLLSDLIKIDSVNPSLNPNALGEAAISDFLGSFLENLGLDIKYQIITKTRKNIIAILKGNGKGKTLMLNGHIDTVSGKGMEKPFDPYIKKGRMYGRGAYDMKGGLVSSIMAIQSIVKAKLKLKGDVLLALVIDEEYTSLGTEELLKEYTADSAIICEPTNSEIVISHKGFVWANIEIFGKAAHGSKPEEGVDAIINAGKVLVELDRLQKDKYENINYPLLGSPSIHASTIVGGLGLSTYPDYCKLSLEKRTLPNEDENTFKEELNDILEKLKSQDTQFKAKLNIILSRPGLEVSENTIIAKIVSAARNKILSKSGFAGESFWMDSALLAEAGIATVIIGPNGLGAHSAIEYVEIDSVINIAKIILNTILEYCEIA